MQNPTIAEILHMAADECLWHPSEEKKKLANFSCVAYCNAVYRHPRLKYRPKAMRNNIIENIDKFINGMGLDVHLSNFHEFKSIEQRQEARYAWLKFAAMMAEEEGL